MYYSNLISGGGPYEAQYKAIRAYLFSLGSDVHEEERELYILFKRGNVGFARLYIHDNRDSKGIWARIKRTGSAVSNADAREEEVSTEDQLESAKKHIQNAYEDSR